MKKILYSILLLVLIGCDRDPSPPTTLNINDNCTFSVSDSTGVIFVSGNLEYEHDYSGNIKWSLGNLISVTGHSQEYWGTTIDLFQYGVSGYNNLMPGKQNADRGLPTFDICNTNYDWGVYCQIEGVHKDEHPRVMTAEEWDYIYEKRPHAEQLRKIYTYSDITYLLLFPDNWLGSYNQKVYNSLDWESTEVYRRQIIENLHLLGIAVLPYIPANLSSYNYPTALSGMYWTSTYRTAFSIYDGVIYDVEPDCFMAVQLVKDAKK